MLIGAHQSASGGVDNVFKGANADECESIQLFVKSPTRWSGKELTDEEVESFLSKSSEFGKNAIVTHSSYLINLASLDLEVRAKSDISLQEEMLKCNKLEIPYYVMHPGSKGTGELDTALGMIAQGIDNVYDNNDIKTMMLLENTAGAGNLTGGELEHLVRIIDKAKHKDKIGVCIDTCHAYVYGYDIKNEYDKFADKLHSYFGDKLKVFHLNDAKKELGTKLDRHEFLGKGFIGIETFERLVNDKRFKDTLGILETPVKDKQTYLEEVRLLKSFRK